MSTLKTKPDQVTITKEQAKTLLIESYSKKQALHNRLYAITEKISTLSNELADIITCVTDYGCPIFRQVSDLYLYEASCTEVDNFFDQVEQEAQKLTQKSSGVKLIKWLE